MLLVVDFEKSICGKTDIGEEVIDIDTNLALSIHHIISFFFFLFAPTLGSLLPLLEHRAEFPQFLHRGQSVGLLGPVISSSQGLYLYTNTEKRTHIHKH
jgi:hypothetical protein